MITRHEVSRGGARWSLCPSQDLVQMAPLRFWLQLEKNIAVYDPSPPYLKPHTLSIKGEGKFILRNELFTLSLRFPLHPLEIIWGSLPHSKENRTGIFKKSNMWEDWVIGLCVLFSEHATIKSIEIHLINSTFLCRSYYCRLAFLAEWPALP